MLNDYTNMIILSIFTVYPKLISEIRTKMSPSKGVPDIISTLGRIVVLCWIQYLRNKIFNYILILNNYNY